jgi:hypothetical protein
MVCRRIWIGWLSLVAGVFWAGNAGAATPDLAPQQRAAARVPLHALPDQLRERVRQVLDEPTLFAHGPAEAFSGKPDFYTWLLDHPDRGVVAWRRLGARCQPVTPRGDGTFAWSDSHGSEIRWQTAYSNETLRVWYAHGKVRPGLLLPPVPVQIVVVLRHGKRADGAEQFLLFHQADVFLQTDSKTAAVTTKMLGGSGPRIAEQCLAQLETFFSGLVWYIDHHPERAELLLAEKEDRPRAAARQSHGGGSN